MDNKEIDRAMRIRLPVMHGGKRYRRVLEYVLWYDDRGERQLSAVLLAEDGNYSVRVPAERVEATADE